MCPPPPLGHLCPTSAGPCPSRVHGAGREQIGPLPTPSLLCSAHCSNLTYLVQQTGKPCCKASVHRGDADNSLAVQQAPWPIRTGAWPICLEAAQITIRPPDTLIKPHPPNWKEQDGQTPTTLNPAGDRDTQGPGQWPLPPVPASKAT